MLVRDFWPRQVSLVYFITSHIKAENSGYRHCLDMTNVVYLVLLFLWCGVSFCDLKPCIDPKSTRDYPKNPPEYPGACRIENGNLFSVFLFCLLDLDPFELRRRNFPVWMNSVLGWQGLANVSCVTDNRQRDVLIICFEHKVNCAIDLLCNLIISSYEFNPSIYWCLIKYQLHRMFYGE